MTLDTKQQVLLALYIEYQKDLPRMKNVTCTALNIDTKVFNIALHKLETEGYITGLKTLGADNDMFYAVMLDNVSITRDGIEFVENKLGILKEQTAKEKLLYIAKKCGVNAMPFLKIIATTAIDKISDII